jgi:hypothetical protein
MEKFGARKEAPLTTCLSEVEQCDIFLTVIAFKLGSVDESSGKSFTQREYERAAELNKEILIYLADEKDTKISPQEIDFDERRQKLLAFKSILKERHTIDIYISDEDEYSKSKKLIAKFLLLPKLYSGKELALKVDFLGEPFPASKMLCYRFNLDYGQTIGLPIKIIQPEIADDSLQYIYLDKEKAIQYLDLQQKSNIEVLAKLQFSEETIEKIYANFTKKIYDVYVMSEEYQSIYSTLPNYVTAGASTPLGWRTEKRIEEAEGSIIAKLTEFLNS